MSKFKNNKYGINLQLFASDNGEGGEEAGDGDDQGDEESDEDGGETKFTQADINKAIARTIAKERKKAEKAQNAEKNKNTEKDSESGKDDSEKTAAIEKASKLEVKVACFEAGVSKEAVEDVTALAKAYMDADADLDLEEAIEKVVTKYPSFKKQSANEDSEENKSWGKRQTGKSGKNVSGVEAAFMKRNPGLKV